MKLGAKLNADWIQTAYMLVGEARRGNAKDSQLVMFTATPVTERTGRCATERFGNLPHVRERAGAGAEEEAAAGREADADMEWRATRLREAGGPARRTGIPKFQDFSGSNNGIGVPAATVAGLSGAHMSLANKPTNVGPWRLGKATSLTLASHVFTILNVFPIFVANT